MKFLKFLARKPIEFIGGVLILLTFGLAMLMDWLGLDKQATKWMTPVFDRVDRWFSNILERLQ